MSNPLVQLDFQPHITVKKHEVLELRPMRTHPHWTLAAWAADASHMNQDPVKDVRIALDVTRAAPARLQRFLELGFIGLLSDDRISQRWDDWFESIALVPIMQTLSIIDFKTTQAGPNDHAGLESPLIAKYGSIRVWAYGITSLTGWLGVIVTGCGCLVVLYEVCIALKDRRQVRSPTQILMSALQHNSNGEFDGLRKEKDVARLSFRLEDDYSSVGRLRFERAR
ncbi:hypothetical protein CERZMDRAFT_99303 [Cercospora zeae-maydis SCOH1-5]|uniref:Uncharacterized protein n=1 Tax=Cercospora zeae-maydis SCOH1-5 TaxID=717836 RepID=A0A6A6FBJ2_9PEZI|nr:hypothetical protein CERZMDRAFT_99303 [Cercospora zeae-maydis SCOH1-5]